MKHVFLTVVLVLAMVCSAFAQEVETEVKWFIAEIVKLGSGTDKIKLQITDTNKAFEKIWVVLEGTNENEMLATAMVAASMNKNIGIALTVPVVQEGEELIVGNNSYVSGVYMMLKK